MPRRRVSLDQLRTWRNAPERDLSLSFLREKFKREVEKPYAQLRRIAPAWNELVPPMLLKQCRLESFSRGVLRVTVGSSAALYELTQLLNGGLERELQRCVREPSVQRVQLRRGQVFDPVDTAPRDSDRDARDFDVNAIDDAPPA